MYRSRQLDVSLPLLEAVLPSNSEQLRRSTDSILDQPNNRIGIVGLALKENTDDLRESPVVALLQRLLGKGRDVRVYDPHIRLDGIYGTNREFILNAIPHIGKLMLPGLDDLLAWADVVVVAQKLAPTLVETINAAHLPVIDLGGDRILPVPEHVAFPEKPDEITVQAPDGQPRILIVAPTIDVLGGQALQAKLLLDRFSLEPLVKMGFLAVNPRLPGPMRVLQKIRYVRTLVTFSAYVLSLLAQVPGYDVLHIFSASYWSFVLAQTPAMLVGALYRKRMVLNYRSGEAEDHFAGGRARCPPFVWLMP